MSVTGFENATSSGRSRRTHQRPRTLPGPAVEGFLCFDPKGRCTFASESVYGMLGYEPGELLGMDVCEFGCPACQENSSDGEKRCAVHRTLQTGEVCRSEHATFRRKDGGSLNVECTSQPIVEESEARGAAVTIVDAVEHGRAEEVRSRYAASLEATTNFVGMADIHGRVLVVNRAGREMVGIGENEELEGTRIADYHPRWATEIVLQEGIPSALREGSWSGETALLTREGKELPVWQMILAHREPDGNVQFLSTTIRDITERKQAEHESMQNRRLFESIAEATPDLLYVAELAGGRNVYANSRAEKILGYDQEQLTVFAGTINDRLVHPEDKARVLANWEGLASLGDGEVQEHEFRVRHADGDYRWLRARNVVLSRTTDARSSRRRRWFSCSIGATGDRTATGSWSALPGVTKSSSSGASGS